MTAPLTPPDCDLRDFQFMPLDVARLRDSDLSALETPEACWGAVLLWGAAWHQVPAASLPDDDRILAQLAGYGRVVKEWLRIRNGALRGFVKCDDGRLYHPVVAEKAIEAWRGKLEQRWRTECARIKKHNQRTGEELPVPTLEQFLAGRPAFVPEDKAESSHETSAVVPRDTPPMSPTCPSGNGIQRERERERERELEDVPDGTLSDGPLVKASDVDAIWAVTPRIARERSSRKDVEKALRAAAHRGHRPAMVLSGIANYYVSDHATKDGGAYAKGCHRMIQEDRWKEFAEQDEDPDHGPGIHAPSERQQRAWAEDWVAGRNWKSHERGPRPGEPGCRITPAILAEFGIGERAA